MPAFVGVKDWFAVTWAELTNTTPPRDATVIRGPGWTHVDLSVDYASKKWRWCGWTTTQRGMKRICAMSRANAQRDIREAQCQQ